MECRAALRLLSRSGVVMDSPFTSPHHYLMNSKTGKGIAGVRPACRSMTLVPIVKLSTQVKVRLYFFDFKFLR